MRIRCTAIGGESAEGVTGVVERYDPTMDSWAELAQKPVAVTDINAAVFGGRIYVPGGRQANNEVTAALEYYDPRQNSWGKGLDLPTPLSAYALAAFEGRLYLFGGWDGKNYLNSVYMYDPSQDKWSALTPMSERRGFAGAAVAGDKIYIMGGYDGKQALANNDVYTPHVEGHGSPWSPAKPLPSGYYDLGVASVADNIYVIGRQGSSKIFSAFVPPINDWQTFDPPTQEINEGSKLTQLGQYLFIVGGKTNGIPRGMTLIYQAIYSVQFPLIIQK